LVNAGREIRVVNAEVVLAERRRIGVVIFMIVGTFR
jgi:hypothetical protein